ncbi:DUF4124 domain-containing protein [Luteimonas viscosa]|uniref:DUF4124 domain-containing protein n=1 Tax=Luteimonas viscosa TaxID=1132694 RepID=UPI003CCDB489
MPRLPFLALAAGLLAASAAYGAEVYQWKDANGVTHYSQTPPPRGSYQQRQITSAGAGTAQQATQAAAPAESPQCANARANVTALSGSRPVHEAGEDGKPGRALNDAERASQLELANAAVKAYCTTPAA